MSIRQKIGSVWRPRWPSRRIVRDLEAASLVLVAAVGVGSFCYKDIYVPSRLPAALVVQPELSEIARWNDTALVRVRVNLANHSPSRVYVPALYYRVSGVDLRGRGDEDARYVPAEWDGLPQSYDRFSSVTREDTLAWRRLLPKNTWFQPGGESRYEDYFVVPACDYDLVRVKVDYFFTKDTRKLAEVRWDTANGTVEPHFLMHARRGAPQPLSNRNPAHLRWKKRYGAGSNWNYAILPLRGTSPAPARSRPCPPRA